MENLFDKVTALAKRRGFIYPGSEIYGGLANTYDYGPMGAELLRNIRNLWWDTFVHKRMDIVGIDASVISHQEIWKASGHTAGFADALIDCRNCKLRTRADHLIEDALPDKKVEGLPMEELSKIIKDNNIKCPNCGKVDWTDVRRFNLLFPVNMGIVEGDQSLAYLRGETAQGMFVNFKNVVDSTRVRLPFGIAQLGKSFRNEITPGNSVFRTLEFEQGEIEYFFDSKKSNWEEIFESWKTSMWDFVTKKLGIKEENLRWREHDEKERSFYSERTEDLEYKFPFGFKELWGLAYRTDYDLTQHEKGSNKELRIVDPETNEKVLPHVIEPAVGINRLFLMTLVDSYVEDGDRVVLKLDPKIAPYKAAIFPLLANKPELIDKANDIYKDLSQNFVVAMDARGNIGKRYFAQDEIGTPFCITVDFQTLEDNTVTVRDRDTASQVRIKTDELKSYISDKLS
ncbi:MAG TPA: glycine--tRNA ligase [Patescibacteria group bacterium]|nr:glycine--tRNA ligase [Patescibacteria group bacterium]